MDCGTTDCASDEVNVELLNSMPIRAQAHCLIEWLPVVALKEAVEDLAEMYQFYKKQKEDIVSSLPE